MVEKSVDARRLKINNDGFSISSNNELTKLKSLVNDQNIDICRVTWVWVSAIPGYDDIGMELVYEKNTGRLTLTYADNGVKEEYLGVSPDCLNKFFKSGKRKIYMIDTYCDGVKYSFNSEKLYEKERGMKPSQDELNGEVKCVIDFIKSRGSGSNVKEWSNVAIHGMYWVVKCTFENETEWFYIQHNAVVKSKKA